MTYIETDRLILRPLRLEDAEAMFEYASDPEITTYVTWDAHRTIEDTKAFLEKAIKDQQQFPLGPLGIVLSSDPEKVIGVVGVRTSSNPYEGVLSYIIARKHWRQGIMFEAASALLKEAFEQHGYKRIYAFCIKENRASSSLMRKLGLQFEGCFKSREYRHERFWDVEYYAILVDEWRQQRAFAEEQESLEYPMHFEQNPSSLDVDTLANGLAAYARQQKDMDPAELFYFFVKDPEGKVLAGCKGVVFYGCVYTDLLWVCEDLRGKGLGTRLVQAAEQYGLTKGCTMATINTMDWEALDLYQSLGYEVDLAREGYKNDSTFYFLRKNL